MERKAREEAEEAREEASRLARHSAAHTPQSLGRPDSSFGPANSVGGGARMTAIPATTVTLIPLRTE